MLLLSRLQCQASKLNFSMTTILRWMLVRNTLVHFRCSLTLDSRIPDGATIGLSLAISSSAPSMFL